MSLLNIRKWEKRGPPSLKFIRDVHDGGQKNNENYIFSLWKKSAHFSNTTLQLKIRTTNVRSRAMLNLH